MSAPISNLQQRLAGDLRDLTDAEAEAVIAAAKKLKRGAEKMD